MSLARLRLREGGEGAEALSQVRARLARVYLRFHEGHSFPDLQEAAALLGQGLAPAGPRGMLGE